jgi:hypothetical protein
MLRWNVNRARPHGRNSWRALHESSRIRRRSSSLDGYLYHPFLPFRLLDSHGARSDGATGPRAR